MERFGEVRARFLLLPARFYSNNISVISVLCAYLWQVYSESRVKGFYDAAR